MKFNSIQSNLSTLSQEMAMVTPANMTLSSYGNKCPPDYFPNFKSVFSLSIAVPEWEATLTAVTLTLIILLVIVGNILVILSVFTHKPLRLVQNFFIVSLAIADLTVAFLVLPLNVAYSITGRWEFGTQVCKLWLTCDIFCCTASILNLCAIALDRYWAITDPINYAQQRTTRRVTLMIVGVWVLSVIISSPPLIGWNDWNSAIGGEVRCKLTSEQGYIVYSSLGSFYIPLFIMTSVYVEVFFATKRRLRQRERSASMHTTTMAQRRPSLLPSSPGSIGAPEQDSVTSTYSLTRIKNLAVTPTSPETPREGVPISQILEIKQRISLSKERRAARTLGIIMGVFVVCWLPFFLMYVIVPFCAKCCPSDKLINFITWLGYINSALNPIIYTIFNLDFRRAFKKLLHIKFGNRSGANKTVQLIESDYLGCPTDIAPLYHSVLGVALAVPDWEAALTALTLTFLIILTIVGNILVILSVFTYKPLRIVQNFFIVSLAVADLTVAILVLPFNVAYSIIGRWEFGIHLCKMWLTCDVLCCTASILNLCAIALDRYWAITDPINYAQKRTLKRVLLMILGVWLLSGLICSPPLVGWNDWPDVFQNDTPCQLTTQQGYVIYSSLGSFYIPLLIMTIVYIEIFIATKRRLRERARASKLNAVGRNMASLNQQQTQIKEPQQKQQSQDQESVSSETNHNEHPHLDGVCKGKKKKTKKKKKGSSNHAKDATKEEGKFLRPPLVTEDSVTDNQDPPSGSQLKDCPNHLLQGDGPNDSAGIMTSSTESPRSNDVVGQKKPFDRVVTVTTPLAVSATVRKPIQVSQFIEEKQRISLSKERRAARTLGIIMGVFVVCWLPFFLMYVILPFCPYCCPSDKFINFITWLGYINSALNPIIYTIFNLDFRRAFKKLLHIKP
uniref:G-protein coupled receptors family 1 profile domain-containing protein n=1 Tax=Timema tahoe TaxID=61484 RepID=A0A7R9FID2_9NEOP|nr:unnamed protein product [Timema tahoe]